MKKLYMLIALVVLTTSFAFATDVPNNAFVTVQCQAMTFVCAGDASFTITGVGAGTSGTATGTTTWNITNNGSMAGGQTFSFNTGATPSTSINPPSGGLASDLTVAFVGSNHGWTTSGLTDNSSGAGTNWKLTGHNCGAAGSATYHYLVTATENSVPGVYQIVFTETFSIP
jgi:hypothetical protein